jgi:hypothetical protein
MGGTYVRSVVRCLERKSVGHSVVHQLSSQSIVILTARAGAGFKHDDRTYIAPIIEFIAPAFDNFIDPYHLNEWLVVVSSRQNLNFFFAQTTIHSKRSSAKILNDWEQLTVFGQDVMNLFRGMTSYNEINGNILSPVGIRSIGNHMQYPPVV